MAEITMHDAGVQFPLFSGKDRSLRSRFVATATGGQLGLGSSGAVIVRALENISLTISEGERVGLIGHNGAGKSTFLRVASRVYRPTEGTATIDGSVLSLIDLTLGINPEATGRQNIYLRASMLGVPKKEITSRFDEIVEFSELGDFIEAPVRTYSSGMQLRLSFSVSTVFAPQILVMDEWLSIGDQHFRNKAEAHLQNLVGSSAILVLASHSRELLEANCTRGLLLQKGEVVMDGPIRDVTEEYFGTKEIT